MTTPVAATGGRPFVAIGGRVVTDLSTYKVLWGAVDTATRYTTLREMSGTAGYAVTAGKTLEIFAFKLFTGNGSTALGITLGYGDTDVGINSASAPTTPIYTAGVTPDATADGATFYFLTQSSASVNDSVVPLQFDVPASKYPVIYTNTGASFGAIFYAAEV